jgi:hypothetical protein
MVLIMKNFSFCESKKPTLTFVTSFDEKKSSVRVIHRGELYRKQKFIKTVLDTFVAFHSAKHFLKDVYDD